MPSPGRCSSYHRRADWTSWSALGRKTGLRVTSRRVACGGLLPRESPIQGWLDVRPNVDRVRRADRDSAQAPIPALDRSGSPKEPLPVPRARQRAISASSRGCSMAWCNPLTPPAARQEGISELDRHSSSTRSLRRSSVRSAAPASRATSFLQHRYMRHMRELPVLPRQVEDPLQCRRFAIDLAVRVPPLLAIVAFARHDDVILPFQDERVDDRRRDCRQASPAEVRHQVRSNPPLGSSDERRPDRQVACVAPSARKRLRATAHRAADKSSLRRAADRPRVAKLGDL